MIRKWYDECDVTDCNGRVTRVLDRELRLYHRMLAQFPPVLHMWYVHVSIARGVTIQTL